MLGNKCRKWDSEDEIQGLVAVMLSLKTYSLS